MFTSTPLQRFKVPRGWAHFSRFEIRNDRPQVPVLSRLLPAAGLPGPAASTRPQLSRRSRETRSTSHTFREGTGSVRFVSVPDFSKSHRFGSVRKNSFLGSTRVGLRFSDASWLGPVRFLSVSGSGRSQNSTVGFGSAGSVRFLTPS